MASVAEQCHQLLLHHDSVTCRGEPMCVDSEVSPSVSQSVSESVSGLGVRFTGLVQALNAIRSCW